MTMCVDYPSSSVSVEADTVIESGFEDESPILKLQSFAASMP